MRYEGMFLNGTTFTVPRDYIEWCKEQHYVNSFNNSISGIWILAFAWVCLVVYDAMVTCSEGRKERLKLTLGIDDKRYDFIAKILLSASKYLIVGYAVWSVWMIRSGGI